MTSNGKNISRYLNNISALRRVLYLVAIVSFVFLLFYQYDSEYKSVILLPIAFILSIFAFVRNREIENGAGKIALILSYTFRMCILPMLCAYGNFWLEPSKDIYMPYFSMAVLLMALENLFVFGLMSFYTKKYSVYSVKTENARVGSDSFIVFVMIIAVILFLLLLRYIGGIDNFYSNILTGEDVELVFSKTNRNSYYYYALLLDILFRPIISFYFVNRFLSKNTRWGVFLSLLIAIANVIIMTDRRVLSILIALVCFMQILSFVKNPLVKNLVYVFMAIFTIGTIMYAFSTDMLQPFLIARKFQRYFSGPTLIAIGINISLHNPPLFIDFFKLLFNDSIILTGLFGSLDVKSYVIELCGPAGKSIWTPMIIGVFQHFSLFGPLVVAWFVRYVVRCDMHSLKMIGIRKMLFDYMAISIAVYMVVYSVELIVYNILFIGGFFRILIYLSNRYRITFGRKYNEQ